MIVFWFTANNENEAFGSAAPKKTTLFNKWENNSFLIINYFDRREREVVKIDNFSHKTNFVCLKINALELLTEICTDNTKRHPY